MNKLIAIGEMLIDFTARDNGNIASVSGFDKNPGGAPANVAVCASRLGAPSALITKLGNDSFGDFLYRTLQEHGVDVSMVRRDNEHHTPLAFVSLTKEGERDFVFLRKHSSDLFLSPEEIDGLAFQSGDILHFGTVDLVSDPVKSAHLTAIQFALKNQMIVSFDPNLRVSLWPDLKSLLVTVNEFIPFAHVLKVSDEELHLISGIENEQAAVTSLMRGNVQLIIVTKGAQGSSLYSIRGRLDSAGVKTRIVDTTGAGDAFIGSFLYQLLINKKNVSNLLDSFFEYKQYLTFANRVAALVCSRKGAIPAMPTFDEIA